MELQDHIVYIAITSNIKIGITIKKIFFNRLMDQGAIKSIILAITPNRYLSGIIEKICKKKLYDKTNYIKMLTNNFNKNINLKKIKYKIKNFISKYFIKYKKFLYKKNKIYKFIYPIIKYPNIKYIKNFNFKYLKNNNFKGKLIGFKGQYLIFNNNIVINFRKLIGYIIKINIIN
ncbi:MAG: DUF2797 domain-containing protein [Candidatus Shikimatogenerans sp. JK-2022]|nr:DUF2797 domain-containing protein [Candidatus Shikimatogenerans bostrichidophilus]